MASENPAKTSASAQAAWITAPVAALVMVATLPGRTQGLGLITEPMLRDLRLDRILYADINLWATLLGFSASRRAGFLIVSACAFLRSPFSCCWEASFGK